MNRIKIIACQLGARHRYAIPKMLEESKLLYRFYTDSNSNSLLGKIASYTVFLSPVLNRLSKRIIKGVPKNKIFNSDKILFKEKFY